jgi:hypothetical protein
MAISVLPLRYTVPLSGMLPDSGRTLAQSPSMN